MTGTTAMRVRTAWMMAVLLAACGGRGGEGVAIVRSVDLELRAALEPALPRVGENAIAIELRDAAGDPVDDAVVEVRVHMAAMGAMPAMGGPAAVRVSGGGRYRAGFALDMGGSWQVEVRAQRPSGAGIEADGSLTVGTPGLRLEGRGSAAPAAGAEAAASAEPAHAGHAPGSGAPPAGSAPEIAIDPGRLQSIGVRMATVEETPFESVVHAVARVTWDESALRDVAPRFAGFVRELYVPAVGERVEQGGVLLTVYAPELVAAQAEYLQARASRAGAAPGAAAERADALVASARARLRRWEVADAEVAEIERRGAPIEALPLRAPVSGVVVERPIVAGGAFAAGERLLRIAPHERVWLEAVVYASELPRVSVGQLARVSIAGRVGAPLEGRVSFVSPDVSPDTRAARVRVELENGELGLPAEGWANVDLVGVAGSRLSVPESAVLYTGRRRFVFVERAPGRFTPRAVEVGERAGERVEVRAGLAAGERVVASGTFLVAAESRLRAALESW